MASRAANASSGDGNSHGQSASYFPEPARRLPARRDFLGATNRRAGSRRSDRSSGRNRPESRENFFKNLQGYPPKCPTPPRRMTHDRKNILCKTTKWNSGSKVGSISNPRRGAARGNTGRAGGLPRCVRSSAPRWTGPRPRPRAPSKFTCGSRGERGCACVRPASAWFPTDSGRPQIWFSICGRLESAGVPCWAARRARRGIGF